MWFRTRISIFVGLCLLIQVNVAAEKLPEDFYEGNEGIFRLQKFVNRLIEKIFDVVEDFYGKIRNKYKCIPDEVPDTVVEILKRTIDCVGSIEKKLQGGRVTKSIHRKLSHRCLGHGKKEVQDLMNSIDPTLNYCPENMTERTYQINITTSFIKALNVNIKNGLEITRKVIYFGNHRLQEDEGEEKVPESEGEYNVQGFDVGEYSEYDQYEEYYGEEEHADDETRREVSLKSSNKQHPKNSSDGSTLVENKKRKSNK